MIFVEDSHDHLETGLFLYGQDFLNTAYDNLEATGFQFLVGLTEDDVQLHVGSRSYAVDDKHHLVASLRLELLAKQGKYYELWSLQQGIFRSKKKAEQPTPAAAAKVVEDEDDGESITY